MEIIYDKKIGKIINNEFKTKKILGNNYNIFFQRFIELLSANNMYEYINFNNGKPHLLLGNFNGCYGIHLNGNYRLIIKPMTDDYSKNGLIICDKVILKGVVDYHDGKQTWKLP